MWTSYSRFYNEILKKETASVFLSKNAIAIARITSIRVFCFSTFPLNVKKIMVALSCLEVFFNKKANLVIANKSSAVVKQRDFQPLGASIFLKRDKATQFLHHLIFLIFSQLDTYSPFFFKKQNLNVVFNLKITPSFLKLGFFFGFFQTLRALQVVFFWEKKKGHNTKFLFLRAYKIPVLRKKVI
jgi:ribosomal protein L5